jgi:hypothetical protein
MVMVSETDDDGFSVIVPPAPSTDGSGTGDAPVKAVVVVEEAELVGDGDGVDVGRGAGPTDPPPLHPVAATAVNAKAQARKMRASLIGFSFASTLSKTAALYLYNGDAHSVCDSVLVEFELVDLLASRVGENVRAERVEARSL